MGSLDDAIREHLELKRQRGATDDEVKRQEEEAFGRGRRPAQEPASAGEPPDDPLALDDPLAPDDLTEADELDAAQPQSNGQPSEHQEPPPVFETEPFEPDEVPAEESLEPELTVRDARDETAEWDETAEPEAAPASNDPLEETPEFLEGSPEEDRLWFEQRPPKDFDLD